MNLLLRQVINEAARPPGHRCWPPMLTRRDGNEKCLLITPVRKSNSSSSKIEENVNRVVVVVRVAIVKLLEEIVRAVVIVGTVKLS